jgi:hypothetical protein
VPLPMKNRMKFCSGPDAVAEAVAPIPGVVTLAAAGPTEVPLAGSPLVVAVAAGAIRELPLSSRRVNAAAVHTSGAAAGLGELPPASQDSSDWLRPDAATPWCAAVITGAAAAAAAEPFCATGELESVVESDEGAAAIESPVWGGGVEDGSADWGS